MILLPLKHTQGWGQHACWATGGLWHPHLSLHSIQDMQLVLATTYSHHCCLAFYTDLQPVCHSILNFSQNFILKGWAMPWGVTFWYHSWKSMSSRFNMLSGSCLTAGGHAASFINQVCIMLVNSFTILGCIMNGAGFEAQACAFLCFRECDNLMCSLGVCSLPFLALAIWQGILEFRTVYLTCVLPCVIACSCLSKWPR